MDTIVHDDVKDDVGMRIINISGGSPYGFRLTVGDDGQLLIGKLRKHGRADEAGLREGDLLVAINGRSCQGMNCSQAMDCVDSTGQSLEICIKRRNDSAMTSTSFSTTTERLTSSTTKSSSSAQERAGQMIFVSPAEPVRISSSEMFTPTTAIVPELGTVTRCSPSHHKQSPPSDTDSGAAQPRPTSRANSGPIIDCAQSDVDVRHKITGTDHTLVLTFTQHTSPSSSAETDQTPLRQKVQGCVTPLVWKPSQTPVVVEATRSSATEQHTSPSKPQPLRLVSQESKDFESPETPTSPSTRASKKLFIDSAFYDDPEHKYPTVEEQIALARRVAHSVLAPANANSRGHKMFVKRRERAFRWEAGYTPNEHNETTPDEADSADLQTSLISTIPTTLTSFVFAPKLPTGETVVDPEKLDAMSSEELERVMMYEKKTTHTAVTPQVCFNLADDLRNMKGKGGRLFAKRQAKSESWDVSNEKPESGGDQTPTAGDSTDQEISSTKLRQGIRIQFEQSSTAAERGASNSDIKCEEPAAPINRLKEMIETPRAAMTPWEAAAKFGTVEPAFHHLESMAESTSVRRDPSKTFVTPGSGSRVKSLTGNPPVARL